MSSIVTSPQTMHTQMLLAVVGALVAIASTNYAVTCSTTTQKKTADQHERNEDDNQHLTQVKHNTSTNHHNDNLIIHYLKSFFSPFSFTLIKRLTITERDQFLTLARASTRRLHNADVEIDTLKHDIMDLKRTLLYKDRHITKLQRDYDCKHDELSHNKNIMKNIHVELERSQSIITSSQQDLQDTTHRLFVLQNELRLKHRAINRMRFEQHQSSNRANHLAQVVRDKDLQIKKLNYILRNRSYDDSDANENDLHHIVQTSPSSYHQRSTTCSDARSSPEVNSLRTQLSAATKRIEELEDINSQLASRIRHINKSRSVEAESDRIQCTDHASTDSPCHHADDERHYEQQQQQ